jgi:ribosome-interacting GTPase 1
MGKGRGKEVIAVVRGADVIIILVDVFNERHFDVLLKELYDAGIRVNVPKPDITIKRSSMGGVRLNAVGTLDLDIEEVRSILAESKIMNAEILIRGNATQDDLTDAVQGNRVYIPAFIAVNKVDLVDKERYLEIEHDIGERFGSPPIMLSAAAGFHTEEVKDAIYDSLGFMRVYLKPAGEEADLDEPLIVRNKSTVEDVCIKLHREFVQKFRYARIWGKSVKHPGQRVGLSHRLIDSDLLSIIVEH